MSNPDAEPSRNGRAGTVTRAWATYVVLLNLLALQRAVAANALRRRVVIFDRHALDSAVRMRFLYGEAGRSRLQRGLLRGVAPRARCAYLLDIRPETSQKRKPDWTLKQLQRQADLYREEAESFGVRRLDGERPRDELCALVAADVWRSLG